MSLRAWYMQAAGRLPVAWRRRLESLPLHVFRWQHEMQLRRAWRSGPPYRPSHRRIIIDISTDCNLGCVDCNRSCAPEQAPSREQMSLEQIERFVAESVAAERRWEAILIEGGEPALHPQFQEVVKILEDYRRTYSPGTWIQVNTNGYSDYSLRVLSQLPKSWEVYSSEKRGRVQPGHLAFNVAPVDLPEFEGADFSGGCMQPAYFGLGLTRYGYYPHPACGGIDRVFGFDIGRKSLPSMEDDLRDQCSRLCRYCGCFRLFNRSWHPKFGLPPPPEEQALRGQMTASWREAYRRYRESPPQLTLY